ncbi:hypothetical protein HY837_02160 [archaeon]|nr:hypothetical protein [archaeon]
MQITFLGTAGNLGVISKFDHLSGGIIIKQDETQLHLDPGVGALANARKFEVNLRENTAILVSNSHLNRCSELNPVISAMTHEGLDPQGVLIVNPNNPLLLEKYRNFTERTMFAEPSKKIGVEEFTITPLKTTSESLGYKIEANNVVISYTGDTNYSTEVVDQYLRSNVLILNAANTFSQSGEGLNSGDIVTILKQIKPDLAVITHYGKSIIQNNPLYEAREIQKQSKVSVLAAKEGMRIDPTAYLGESRQRILQFITRKSTE